MSFQKPECSPSCFVLIDDNLGDLHLMEVALKQLFKDSKVLAFESGEAFHEYWESANTGSPPIKSFFIDYNMSGMSGKDVLNYLKSQTEILCPIYIFSGALLASMKEDMLALGATDFLEKPLDFDSLVSLLADLFDPKISIA
ncbi:MAG: response regulator [Bacteroidia bacterium]|nr:response regulator [Bacteroidia bacterium]